jgi:hypothetical protein
MASVYELCLLGPDKLVHKAAIQGSIEGQFTRVGLDFSKDGKLIVDAGEPDWGGIPVAIWFGGSNSAEASDSRVMKEFLTKGFTVFPVVSSLDHYSTSVPPELKPINGQVWDADKVAADVMRGFRLARKLRQVFISYKRTESSGVAHQLFHELNERGFRVFLDSASVDAGVEFQRALWSRMADVDIVILLDTPTALNSTWVHQELNRAHDLGLGVVQLIWPDHSQYPGTELSFPIHLKATDFEAGRFDRDGILTSAVVVSVIRVIESERIRSLSARRSRLVEGLLEYADAQGATVSVHPTKNLQVLKGEKKILEIIPFVGVPDALALFQFEQNREHEPTIVAYNGLGVDEEWADHLTWLNSKGVIQAFQIDDLGTCIGGLK